MYIVMCRHFKLLSCELGFKLWTGF